jgi:hypothetical protein
MQLDLRVDMSYWDGPLIPSLEWIGPVPAYDWETDTFYPGIVETEMDFATWFQDHIDSRSKGLPGLIHKYLRRKDAVRP